MKCVLLTYFSHFFSTSCFFAFLILWITTPSAKASRALDGRSETTLFPCLEEKIRLRGYYNNFTQTFSTFFINSILPMAQLFSSIPHFSSAPSAKHCNHRLSPIFACAQLNSSSCLRRDHSKDACFPINFQHHTTINHMQNLLTDNTYFCAVFDTSITI